MRKLNSSIALEKPPLKFSAHLEAGRYRSCVSYAGMPLLLMPWILRYPNCDLQVHLIIRISDTSTFDVTNNTVIYVTYGNDRSTVYRFTLDYVNKDQCFVGHCNCTETQYYLFDSPDSDIFQYHECLKKIDNYSGGNITFLRDLQKCQKIPPKP
ncbi:hypothetical protein V5799_009415 [Amblyomma americanum]|uniref:Uncharacterized protein n=1 Tax=Amblyomma americanum TaxID=6943 RepID=A0AAQ4FAG8_AMBAM